MNEMYLIPANSKKSKLILGMFRPIDLIIFATGVAITFIFIMLGFTKDITQVVITMIPAGICALLVMPVPNYHNVLVAITNVITYFMNPKRFYWKGWRIYDDDDFK
ncbi:MAG: hypothetical protein IJO32_07445 [Bacilli bacterium]|nr:hypothetical protein [Bacilli bacterium]